MFNKIQLIVEGVTQSKPLKKVIYFLKLTLELFVYHSRKWNTKTVYRNLSN